MARKMPLQKEFVTSDAVFAMGDAIAVERHLIDQQHGLAMRQQLLDFFSVHSGCKVSQFF